ncbi:ABC transporter permease [Aquabacterium lacunae]|uniref:ABC transporter permease n=1 Tax=Aquabacterium lacunae TaxID=2528630 RepID=A0A4Q9GVI8_9BURK|nr:ABC transporter permease [Aquabacterium lacunae]TBO27886.1 ABC transporter permease [Aquabacterium lacunae]
MSSTLPSAWPLRAANLFDALGLPLLALAGAVLLFGGFVWLGGASPVEAWVLLFKGAFGDAFSWQNTLQRAAPLMLTALCVAIPFQAGLMVIGGEGALVLGGLACAALPMFMPLPVGVPGTVLVLVASAAAGAAWIALVGAMRQFRGVNETIGSLLMGYLAIGLFKHWVEGPLRDPASLNKPSTLPLPETNLLGLLPGWEVHWGLVWGVVACVAAGLWLLGSTHGFATRVVGGNARAARLVGLPSHRLILTACALGGAGAGLAGGIEVAAVHTSANASLIVGLGYTGILVSFVARHQPLAIVPVAILFGGFGAAGSLLQRRLDLPDASVLVLQGFAFVLILAAEAWRGRLGPWLTARAQMAGQAEPTHETSRQRLQREALAALRKRKEAA